MGRAEKYTVAVEYVMHSFVMFLTVIYSKEGRKAHECLCSISARQEIAIDQLQYYSKSIRYNALIYLELQLPQHSKYLI